MSNILIESVIKNSSKQNSFLDKILENASGDITPYNDLISKVITRASLTSTLPYMVSIIPSTTANGKIPVATTILTGKDSQQLTVLSNLKILKVQDSSAFAEDGDISSEGTGVGKVIYVEEGHILVNITVGSFLPDENIDNTTTYSASKTIIDSIHTATHGVGQVLRNYVGEYSTEDGELLNNIRKIDNKIFLTSTETKTKKLRSGYTIELLQDAFNIYGYEYNDKIVQSLANVINTVTEQNVMDFMISNAVQLSDLVLTNSYGANTSIASVYEDIYARINRSIGNIGTNTRVNGPFVVTASSNVVAALQTLKVVKEIDGLPNNSKIAGKMKNGAILVEDGYSLNDYFVVSVKGSDDADNSSVIYSPYTIELMQATDKETFEEYIGLMLRDSIINSPLATDAQEKNELMELTYVDFTNLTNF